jgi:hypothetical protein
MAAAVAAGPAGHRRHRQLAGIHRPNKEQISTRNPGNEDGPHSPTPGARGVYCVYIGRPFLALGLIHPSIAT